MNESLSSIVHKYAQAKVLVIGDAMMDQYHFGRVDRLSPEAPVPVFIEERQKGRPGGAANVACNVEALGAQIRGHMPMGSNISAKHRYVAGHHQLLRIDRDVYREPAQWDIEYAVELASWADVVILSDYAKGWLTDKMCQAVISTGVRVVVDPKGFDYKKYQGAYVICPNSVEFLQWQQSWKKGDTAESRQHYFVKKCGAEGLTVYGEQGFRHLSSQAKQVFDVTGAGDTVVAALACSLAAGADLYEAATLANLAAGVVVGKVGTSVCTQAELLACVSALPMDASTSSTLDTNTSCVNVMSSAIG